MDTEVLVERGDPGMGVSGDVLVTADDGTSLSSSGFVVVTASTSTSDFFSGSSGA